uniref:Uncharacterized protein n=1 Tax=Yersinia enterocolitica TaxID=630 RepID=B0RKP7_YEREN|nr:hypothetical protein [Yersinia enterocolitica]
MLNLSFSLMSPSIIRNYTERSAYKTISAATAYRCQTDPAFSLPDNRFRHP